jgi:hypothetical protein
MHVPQLVIELGISCTSLGTGLTHPRLYSHCCKVVLECEAKPVEMQQEVLSDEFLQLNHTNLQFYISTSICHMAL